ncbi:hypothetical protein C1646_719900 [Rhizophagus diaphanus]|nr:hypothetical protein C1646_719900 [Rhizophagus diaphanus] [Rhizophagus sp. MUCL 43196]
MSNPTNRFNKSSSSYSPEIDDIPDDEKMRLIKESGIFKTLNQVETERQERSSVVEEDDDPYAHGPIFKAFIYTIPLCSVYSVMDILVHRQYNEDVSFLPFSARVLKMAPILWFFVYYTNKNVNKTWMQAFMFLGSIVCGSYMIYIFNKISYSGVMRKCPPVSTLWIYFVLQLNLLPSALSLVFVFLFFWIGGFKLG